MIRRALWLASVLLGLRFLGACSPDTEHVAATQITLRIYASEEVRERMRQLHVRSYRDEGGGYRIGAERYYDKSKLGDVIDLVLAPSSDNLEGTLLVIVDALDRDGKVLVQTRATLEFLPREQRLLELWLYPCELKNLGELCSDSDCVGDTCLTCVENRCAPTPHYNPRDLEDFDPDQDASQPKQPDWLDAAQDASPPVDACAVEGCPAPDAGPGPNDGGPAAPDAGLDGGSGPKADAGMDAGSDAGFDAGVDAGFDAGRDAGFDAGVDAGVDTGAPDTGTPDTGSPDTGTPDTGAPEGGTPEGGTPPEPPGRCAQAAAWTAVAPFAAIPAGARVLAGHTSSDRGSLPQYICRVLTPDGSTTPGKVSQDPANAALFDFGCFAAYLSGATWLEYGNIDRSSRFQVLTPPSECVLDWVTVPVGGALPARALAIGTSIAGAALYSCRIPITTTTGGVTRTGTHIGRVSASAGDLCRVQYYSVIEQRNTFEVLVQTRP